MKNARGVGEFLLSSLYFFVIFVYLYSAPPKIAVISIVFSVLHETAHVLTAKLLGRRTDTFRLSFFGLYPDLSEGSRSSCIAIFAAGPAVNLISAAIATFFFSRTHSDTALYSLCVNMLAAIYNLLPLPFSDGDGIIRAVLAAHPSSPFRFRLCAALNLVFSLFVFAFFSYRFLFLSIGLFSFLCSFVFLVVSVGRLFGE